MKERTGAREGDARSHMPVFSCAHYFQAPASQAIFTYIMHTYARGYKYITRYLKETILLVDNS